MLLLRQDDTLREEIAKLGEMLGDTICEIAGDDALQVVEEVRRLAWSRRCGDAVAGQRLTQLIAALGDEQLRVVIRAFSIFLDLTNLAEDRQRVRVLSARQRAAFPNAPGESIADGIFRLKMDGRSANEMQHLLDRLHIELVFTAHPTEAKRRSVRSKLRTIRQLLNQLDSQQFVGEQEVTERAIRTELAKLWQTDVVRPWRPSVMQEVERGLSIKPVLWDVIPQILRDLRCSLEDAYAPQSLRVRPCVTFGSWIGGDRDGHPYVTPEITEQTFLWLRQAALEFHMTACSEHFDSLSLSQRQMPLNQTFVEGISAACRRWPELDEEVRGIPPNEACRRWIGMIRWRVQQTQQVSLEQETVGGAYSSAAEMAADVTALLDAITESPSGHLLAAEVQAWLDRIETFGFHLARLDVRQDARRYRSVVDELLLQAGLCADPAALEEAARQELLLTTLEQRIELVPDRLSQDARETWSLFQLLQRVVKAFGPQAVGGHVISMTHSPSDVIAVLWLWQQASFTPVQPEPIACLPIIPLFETIDDLRHAPAILEGLLRVPAYRQYLRRQQDRQTVMLGYSDSTKDGGYLSACWSLYEAQQQLQAVASEQEIELTFFHGRGGSLGRGGGPAARSILSLPAGTFHGSLRLTEQGEVLAERYDDPSIARRHLEQVVWSSLVACGEPAPPARTEWEAVMKQLEAVSYHAYRDLIEQPHFVEYFRRATPIPEVEQLPMGSRPSRRSGGNRLSDLRAIPWVFSWTQCRCLIPAWYGFGSAVAELLSQEESRRLLQSMYRDWPFFRATIDNAELALAKTDLRITQEYARLVEDSEALTRIGTMISDEFVRSRDAILAITENPELLDGTPWLKESIRVRNRYIDPLNLIQVELLRRLRSRAGDSEEEDAELQHLTRLTIKGLAAGMRTTG